MKKIGLLFLLISSLFLQAKERPSSKPYVSGDTFRQYADFIFDETKQNFNPALIKKGDTIFVSTEPIGNLKKFFQQHHPQIKHPYILITHNGDPGSPGKLARYLEDKKLFAWFAQNVDTQHPKLIPIPIGLENVHIGRRFAQKITKLRSETMPLKIKRSLLYVNFSLHTNPKIRVPLYQYFKKLSFCQTSPAKKTIYDYLVDVCYSHFILSPHGNGLDCHRTWEALLLGTIPIVKTSTLDELYKDLPVVIVNDWKEITKNFLEQKLANMKNREYDRSKLYFSYWQSFIFHYQTLCRTS